MPTTAYDLTGTVGMLEGTLDAAVIPPDPGGSPKLTYCFCICSATPAPEPGGAEA